MCRAATGVVTAGLLAGVSMTSAAEHINLTTGQAVTEPFSALRLPGSVPPVMAVWGWTEADFKPRAYEPYLTMMARHSGVSVLTTTIRAAGKFVTDPAVREHVRQRADLIHIVKPEDVAEVIAFLCSDHARLITANILHLR